MLKCFKSLTYYPHHLSVVSTEHFGKSALGESYFKGRSPTPAPDQPTSFLDNSPCEASSFLKIPGCIWMQPVSLVTPLHGPWIHNSCFWAKEKETLPSCTFNHFSSSSSTSCLQVFLLWVLFLPEERWTLHPSSAKTPPLAFS